MLISKIREIVERISSQKKKENVYPFLTITLRMISIVNIDSAIIVTTSNPTSAFYLVHMMRILEPKRE